MLRRTFVFGVCLYVGFMAGVAAAAPRMPPEVSLAPIVVPGPREYCRATVGPIPWLDDGWEWYGVICPEGSEPDGSGVR